MKKTLVLLILFVSVAVSAQNFEYKWQRVKMDSTYEGNGTSDVEKLISKYSPELKPYMEILAYSEAEMPKKGPESGLTNLAADVILNTAKNFIKNDYPTLSLTNFGGIRVAFPKGAIRKYDVLSTFPFTNKIVVVQIKGKEIKKLLSRFAGRNKFEALGGVKIEVEDRKVTKCEIGGKPLKKNKVYNLATIDFVLGGGDKLNFKIVENSLLDTDVQLNDAVVAYLKELNENKIVLSPKGDGRIIIK